MVKGNLPVWHAVEWDNEGPNLCLMEGYPSTSVSQIDSCTVCTHGYNFFRPVLTRLSWLQHKRLKLST